MSNTLRILDANANRAREALRVMEEAARFLLDDENLTRDLKQLRHDLAAAVSHLPGLELHRDTPGDVGTHISTTSENTRRSIHEVVIAAGKRLGEALRVIEEYGKTLGLVSIESLRYRAYELERQLHARLGSPAHRQFRLCLLLTESQCRLPWRDVVEQAIGAGCDCVQVREKLMEAAALLQRVRELVQICRPHGVAVIVNDRPDIALIAQADGVHLGQNDLPADEVRKIVGRRLLIGVSTSRLDEAQRAFEKGADYCGIGPMFPTTTKHKDVIVGPEYLSAYLQWGQLPGLAIGGITPGNVKQLTGVKGIAVSACVCGSDTPGAVVAQLRSSLP
ncbi:MAG: thiamine phosphate synthase [Phycisphaeraceae bacterium]|nr:thiamine phosphate synthase [Phycisphaeraceae bacterium]